jgi:hypothetical protein
MGLYILLRVLSRFVSKNRIPQRMFKMFLFIPFITTNLSMYSTCAWSIGAETCSGYETVIKTIRKYFGDWQHPQSLLSSDSSHTLASTAHGTKRIHKNKNMNKNKNRQREKEYRKQSMKIVFTLN